MTRLTKNVIYNTAGQGLVLVLSLLAVRFIFRRLGDDVFGLIFFNLVLTAVLTSILELGVSSTVVREISIHFDSEPGYIRNLIRTASLFYWTAGILLVVVIWITAPLLVTHWVNLKTIDPGTAATTLRILSANTLVALPKGLYASMFRGRQMMGINNVIDVATAATQQVVTLLLLLSGGHVYVVAAGISASNLLGLAAYVVAAGRVFGWRTLIPSFSTEILKRNVSFSGRMTVVSVLILIHLQAAQILVSKLLPIAVFGLYGFAASMVNRATIVTGAVAQAAFPSFSSLYRAQDRVELMSQYRKLQDLLTYGTVPLFAGACFAALPVYKYVLNPDAAWLLLVPTAWLSLGTYMNGAVSIPYMFALAVGRPDIPMKTMLLGLIVVLPVTALLIFKFSLAGAGFSWVFYQIFNYSYMAPRICRECLLIRPRDFYMHVGRAMAWTVVTYGLAWIAIAVPSGYSLAGLVIAYLIASIAFAAGALFLIGPDLKVTISKLPIPVLARAVRL
jgi:O-antigen/teichoic acid export membrane protein